MSISNWENIESVFHLALNLAGPEREQYLARACEGNAGMRDEIDSLLASFEDDSDFLDQPAFDLGMKIIEGKLETNLSGSEIGFYKILDKLGSGGMGDVYLAEDTKLNRKVALKFLSPSLVDDNWAKRQLFREAQAVAMLDHPNICPVYGIEEIDKHSFIVMQHVEGETLSDLLKRDGAPDAKQMLSICRQITSALNAAHAHGIIHRDIKTRNIMITPAGQVKVLDFGLAKIIKQQKQDNLGESINPVSQKGLIVGTIAYMSPEQLRAEKLDFRTDIFSLGTVIYEVASGKHPFLQTSDAETISAILTKSPEPVANAKNGGAAVNHIVRKCLEKDKEKRYQSASELLLELQNLPNKRLPRLRTAWRIQLALVLVLCVLLLTVGAMVYRTATRTRTVAVLPFINQSADSQVDYLSGMDQTMISKLSGFSQISVKPYTQVSMYKSADDNPVEVGRSLNVEAVLTGRIVKRNDQLILETKLFNIADGNQMCCEDKILNDQNVLQIQDEISQNVIDRLQSSLNRGIKSQTARNEDNAEAYKFYLQGLHHWKDRGKKGNIQKAIDAFSQARSIDPSYARANSGLANAYVLRALVDYTPMRAQESRDIALLNAQLALKNDGNLCESHTAFGVVQHKYEWNWAEAEKEYKRAIELNPDDAQTHYWYSDLLAINKRTDEALFYGRRAQELDPSSAFGHLNIGRILYYADRYDEAFEQLNKALKVDGNSNGSKNIIGLIHIKRANYNEALKIFEGLYAEKKIAYAAALGFTYAKMGRKSDALRVLDELHQQETADNNIYIPPQERAIIYTGLGDKDKAFEWLEKALQDRFPVLPAINVEPLFDDLRDDPRFQNLLARMNLNQDLALNASTARF